MLRGGGDVELKQGGGMSGSRAKACWGRIRGCCAKRCMGRLIDIELTMLGKDESMYVELLHAGV